MDCLFRQQPVLIVWPVKKMLAVGGADFKDLLAKKAILYIYIYTYIAELTW